MLLRISQAPQCKQDTRDSLKACDRSLLGLSLFIIDEVKLDSVPCVRTLLLYCMSTQHEYCMSGLTISTLATEQTQETAFDRVWRWFIGTIRFFA